MTTTRLRERVTTTVIEPPQATATGAPQLTLALRRKTFGRLFGAHDWIGLRLDRRRVEVREPLTEAYRLPAPRKPAAPR